MTGMKKEGSGSLDPSSIDDMLDVRYFYVEIDVQ